MTTTSTAPTITHDPFGGSPANWSLPDLCDLCSAPLGDGSASVHAECAAYMQWVADMPEDMDARAAWDDEQEALYLRELEERERIGNDFSGE